MLYFVLKSLHIISDIVWVGGMLVNAFVIAMVPPTIRTGVIAAVRPFDRRITTVAEGGAWLFGIILAIWYGWYATGWFGFKFLIVVMLSALHGMQAAWLRRMEADPHLDPPAFVRVGMPIVLVSVVAIVLLAVVKPF
ncbi:CopD family protein [Pseudorhizobium flavum]|jgi:putative membrane protein|uniref:Protoporphyrinogen IX oxidase n=1 Tax=Pseudorhizobium flavum TaxID=1335061 RepID=A0A7X0DC42_9HYPH|nr:CopD family protein [Pseudorhizobium flavum]MBB6179478.1 putative membrane protein [Pseudorhizobium flavum]CAD6605894.1 protoporphyrinogen oxidase HemJ [Pseudorhizobium flavum]